MFKFLIVLDSSSYRKNLSSNLSLVLPNDSPSLAIAPFISSTVQCWTAPALDFGFLEFDGSCFLLPGVREEREEGART